MPGQGAPLFELRPPVLTGWAWAVKRGFDLVVSVLLIVIGLPLWLLIAFAIKIGSRGPIFFVDRRIGVGEREFGMLKFRTMVADAAELQPKLEDVNEAEGALSRSATTRGSRASAGSCVASPSTRSRRSSTSSRAR